ncbi:hypothetical protein D3H65_15370 [Paraflavitalea soli]|uniref:Uncharacterized protein n=1 Tax=Paraflavitalea soli TaxID=2315862 RepID=A0A3B7MMC4_9BACT|nr:hypothetical protein [Paraflavitalea soli]AXY75278.1 hypothetical protein D3H65_15370 [Paraflavitalea soli]
MNRKIILPAVMLVLTSMLATVIEATAKMGHNNKIGVMAKWKLVPMVHASEVVLNDDPTNEEPVLQGQASMLNLHALKAINGIVKEFPDDHSTSFQGTR